MGLDRKVRERYRKNGAPVTPSMTVEQIKEAEGTIDLPYESPAGQPPAMLYEDLGDGKGWDAPEGFRIAGKPYAEVVAGIGSGARTFGQTQEERDLADAQAQDAEGQAAAEQDAQRQAEQQAPLDPEQEVAP